MRPRTHYRWRISAALVAILALALAACGSDAPQDEEGDQADTGDGTPVAADRERILVIGVEDDPSAVGVDPDFGGGLPIRSMMVKNVAGQWFHYERLPEEEEGYIPVDETSFYGDIIESWNISDDGLSIDLKLREGLYPHYPEDADEITTEDIACWQERVFEADSGSTWVHTTAGVNSQDQVHIEGDYEFRIELEEPNPLFLALFRDQSATVIDCSWSDHVTEDDPFGTTELSQRAHTPGPWKVAETVAGTEVRLEWNEDWWQEEPYFTEVRLRHVPSSTERAQMLRNGEIDIAMGLSSDELENLRDGDGVKVWSVPSRNQATMGLNHQMEPFDDVRVRQAIAHAVPYDDVLEGAWGGRVRQSSGGPVPLESAWPTDVEWPYDYDLDRARELLDEAGLADGFSFTAGITADNETAETVAVLIQDSLAELGIEMTISPDPEAVFNERQFGTEYEAYVSDQWNSFVDAPFYYLNIFYASDLYCCNFMAYANDDIDALRDELAVTIDPDDIAPLWEEAVQIMVDDVAVVSIADLNWELATRDDIRGLVVEPDSLLSLYELRRE